MGPLFAIVRQFLWHTPAMMIDDRLPDWPPPPDAPIGEDRARAYIAWIRDRVRPLLEEGRRMIRERYPSAYIGTYVARLDQLATWRLTDGMDGLNIGGLWCEPTPGSFAWVNIIIRRDGRLEVRPGQRMG